jgi:hypothetical protein
MLGLFPNLIRMLKILSHWLILVSSVYFQPPIILKILSVYLLSIPNRGMKIASFVMLFWQRYCRSFVGKVVKNCEDEALAPQKRGKSYFPLTYPITTTQEGTTKCCHGLRGSVRG